MEINSFWKNKRVFITGATGLVGSWLVRRLLEQKAFIVALVKDFDPQSELIRSNLYQEVTLVNGKLENYITLEHLINEHEIDTVFHLGAQTLVGTAYRSPLSTFEANIRGTYNLLEACRIHQSLVKRIVIASSDKAYGSSEVLPYTEEMPLIGKHPYDVSKSCTDLIAQTYFHTYDLPIVIARCGNIFGGGDLNWSRLIPGTIRSFLFDQVPIIRSDGQFTRDYIFIQDVIDAYLMMGEALEREDVKGEAFNFGPAKPFSVMQVLDQIASIMNVKTRPQILNQAVAEIRDQYLSSEKALRVFNWQPRYSLKEGLIETIYWYESYFSKNESQEPMTLIQTLRNQTLNLY